MELQSQFPGWDLPPEVVGVELGTGYEREQFGMVVYIVGERGKELGCRGEDSDYPEEAGGRTQVTRELYTPGGLSD